MFLSRLIIWSDARSARFRIFRKQLGQLLNKFRSCFEAVLSRILWGPCLPCKLCCDGKVGLAIWQVSPPRWDCDYEFELFKCNEILVPFSDYELLRKTHRFETQDLMALVNVIQQAMHYLSKKGELNSEYLQERLNHYQNFLKMVEKLDDEISRPLARLYY